MELIIRCRSKLSAFGSEIKERIINLTKEIISKSKGSNDTSLLEKELDDLIYSAIEEQKFNNVLFKNFSLLK